MKLPELRATFPNFLFRMGLTFSMGAGAIFLTAAPAHASEQTGTITKVVMNSGRVLFWMSGTRTTRPSCDCCSRWEITVGDANSQALMSLVMTAYAGGKTVYIDGTGTCVGGPNDTEGVWWFQSE